MTWLTCISITFSRVAKCDDENQWFFSSTLSPNCWINITGLLLKVPLNWNISLSSQRLPSRKAGPSRGGSSMIKVKIAQLSPTNTVSLFLEALPISLPILANHPILRASPYFCWSEAILMSTHNMFLWRNKKNYPFIIAKYPPCLFFSRVSCCACHSKDLGQGHQQFFILKNLYANYKYRKNPKHSDTWKLGCNHPNVMHQKDADGIANSSLIWVCIVCPDLPLQKLRIIMLRTM